MTDRAVAKARRRLVVVGAVAVLLLGGGIVVGVDALTEDQPAPAKASPDRRPKDAPSRPADSKKSTDAYWKGKTPANQGALQLRGPERYEQGMPNGFADSGPISAAVLRYEALSYSDDKLAEKQAETFAAKDSPQWPAQVAEQVRERRKALGLPSGQQLPADIDIRLEVEAVRITGVKLRDGKPGAHVWMAATAHVSKGGAVKAMTDPATDWVMVKENGDWKVSTAYQDQVELDVPDAKYDANDTAAAKAGWKRVVRREDTT